MRTYFYSVGTIITVLSFCTFYLIAATLYPGGTWADPSTLRHSFGGNYLCDVLKVTAHNGLPNIGRTYGFIAFFFLFAALLFWWALLTSLLPKQFSTLRKVVRIATFLSAAGFVGMIFAPPSPNLLSPHFFAVITAVLCGLAVTFLLLASLLKIPAYRSLGQLGFLLISPVVPNISMYIAYHLNLFTVSVSQIIFVTKIVVINAILICLLSALKQIRMTYR
ncbi:MAG: hypothetical protein AAF963_02885 [Bacteroidota bacterium]